jgi:CHASE2 domain-containing sensor protein
LEFKYAVKASVIRGPDFIKSALGAAVAVICGLLLWKIPLGEAWVNSSYDYLFRFDARHTVTNKVVVVLMDNEAYAYDEFHQRRKQPWDRGLHAKLLNRLKSDGCALVVFDCFFRGPGDSAKDEALAAAIRKQDRVVLMEQQAQVTHPDLDGFHPTPPSEPFLSAAKTNVGVAWLDPDLGEIVRKHWPFPAPEPGYPSLPWTAARLCGAQLFEEPHEQWLRYYGKTSPPWQRLSYRFAFTQPTNYFRDQIVFVGAAPETTVPGDDEDEFQTPYTRWTGESTAGVEIMVTEFLNLMNHDWLERPAWWIEALLLIVSGTLLGGLLCRVRPVTACVSAVVIAVAVAFGAVSLTYFTNYWFPWLVVAGGQVPCALAWSVITSEIRRTREIATATELLSKIPPEELVRARVKATAPEELPDAPDYELIHPPFGEGAYGKVWLARNAIGQWQALKVVYLANFKNNADPFEREFNGIRRYKPVSDKHPGLLRVDFVSKKRPKYFYYVMELGDALDPNWEKDRAAYKPRDLASERARLKGKRLPVRDCIVIGLALTDALDFLHREGLTHRDIKPQNIIFVNGQPKLADVGLISEIRPEDEERTFVGTPGYMPPPPERPGTAQADLYSLGMVLYVLMTGRNAAFFPDIATTLVDSTEPDFLPLNAVILKACQPDCAKRYSSAAEMKQDLQKVLNSFDGKMAEPVSPGPF